MTLRQSGFSHILLFFAFIIIIGIASFAGWKVIAKNNSPFLPKTQRSNTQTQRLNTTPPTPFKNTEAMKEYVNSHHAFSFRYPSTWKLEEHFVEGNFGVVEGSAVVVSKNNTVVEFSVQYNGKGGDCWDDQANARTARTCATADILRLEPFSSGIDGEMFYYYEAKVTESQRDGGDIRYEIGVMDDKSGKPVAGPYLTDTFINMIYRPTGTVTIKVRGENDSQRASANFLKSTEVQEAYVVLKSLRLIKN